MLRLVAVLSTLTVLALAAAPAQAAPVNRYAAPSGVGAAPCVQAAPCSLSVALGAAKSGDDVLVTAGTYVVSGQTAVPSGADLRAAPGAGRPTLAIAPSGQVRVTGTSTIAGLELVKNNPGSAMHLSDGAIGERLLVRGTVPASTLIGIEMYANTVLRDSIVAVDGPGTQAVQSSGNGNTYTTTLRNDTLIATGNGAMGANLSPVGPGTETHHVVNTILSGTESDLVASAPNAAGTVLIDTHSSNYTTVKSTGPGTKTVTAQARQTAEPLFVGAPANASAGDYHQLAASPTIDAGTSGDAFAAVAGAADFDDEARTLGAAVDIGADERMPALPQDDGPLDPGTSDPGAQDPGTGGDPAAPPAGPAPLDPPSGGTPAPPPISKPALAQLRSARVTLAGRVVALKLACPKGATACGGTLTLRGGKTKLGTAKVKVAAGRTATARITLSKQAAKTVARYGHAGRRVDAVITAGARTKTTKLLLRGR